MTRSTTAIAAAAALAFAATGAFAQSSSTSAGSGAMSSSSGAMSAKPMTASQMAKMKKCQAMSHDAMMKSASCKKMMKAHPEMMQSDSMAH